MPNLPKLERVQNNAIVVYTDGSCLNNGYENARAGIGIFWVDDHPDNFSGTLDGRQTNNRAELNAAIIALQMAQERGYGKLHIVTDSKYLMLGTTRWIYKWRNNGWRDYYKNRVANKRDWQRLWKEMRDFGVESVSFQHVPSHQGYNDQYGNRMADKLAKEAAANAEYSDSEYYSDDD